MSKSGIVNVRMVITEEKILSNIDKVQKLINPNSKKQIVQLEDDAYFKDLIEYPKKKNFPVSVYKAAYGLVEYATNQFEENTKKIEELIRQREKNISLAASLKTVLESVEAKSEGWKEAIKGISNDFSEDIIETLGVIGRTKSNTSDNYKDALKLINARIGNLETNLHIEIDMERIEDKSKALSYIGIEIADALKLIPAPEETLEPVVEEKIEEISVKDTSKTTETAEENQKYIEETRVDVKPTLWQRIKNSKIVRAIKYVMKIKVVIEMPNSLPEGRGE